MASPSALFVDGVISASFNGKDIVYKAPGVGFFRATVIEAVDGGFRVTCYKQDGATFEKWIAYRQARAWYVDAAQVDGMNAERKGSKGFKPSGPPTPAIVASMEPDGYKLGASAAFDATPGADLDDLKITDG